MVPIGLQVQNLEGVGGRRQREIWEPRHGVRERALSANVPRKAHLHPRVSSVTF